MKSLEFISIAIGILLLTSCGLATKRDIADLKKDVQEVREEVRSGAHDQAKRQNELVGAVRHELTEKKGLAGMIARRSPWSWFGIEFALAGGFSFFAALRLNRVYIFRRAPVTDDEYESLTIASWVLNKFLGRRQIEPPKTDPDQPGPGEPPYDKPPLTIVK